MKPSGLFSLSGLAAAFATAASAMTAIAATPQEILREMQNISRDKNATIEAVSNAYAAVSCLTNINQNQRGEAAKQFANAHVAKGLREAALAFAEENISSTNLPAAARASLFCSVAKSFADANMRDAFGSYRHDGFDNAVKIYAMVLGIPDATQEIKIEAFKNIADMTLEATRDLNGALATLDKAIAIPGLDPDKKALAECNKAAVLHRAMEYDKALAILNPIAANDTLPDNRRRAAMWKSFDAIKAKDGAEAALKAYREANAKLKDSKGEPLCSDKDIAHFCIDNDIDIDFAVRAIDRQIAEWKWRSPDFGKVFSAYAKSGFDTFKTKMPAFVSKISEKKDWVSNLFNSMTGRDTYAAGKDGNYPETVLALLDAVAVTNRPAVGRLFDYASKYETTAARALAYAKEIGKLPEDSKETDKNQRKNAAVFAAIADANGNGGRAVSLLNEWLKKNPPADNLERADFLLRGVKRAMALRQDDAAKAIYAERAKLVRKEEPRSLHCPFIENAPQDISAILASDFYAKGKKGLADRKFGDDLKFIIETDVTAKRDMTEFNGKPFRPTEIFAFCDASGVYVMLRSFYDKATLQNFRNGFGGVAGYEAYIAPGFDSPYTFLGFSPGETKLDSDFLTQYDNDSGYRNLKSEDDSILLSNYVAEDSVISLLRLSWIKEFANLPSNGDKWYFEPLCWAQGGWSWGGSKTVHNRSNFGALVFEGITPKAAAEIRRGILSKALGAFNRAKQAGNNGCLEFWKDPELGDPDFYRECVEPLIARLNPYASKVNPEMSDSDVMDVYENAAKDWLNIDFIVSGLRTRYLARKLTE